MIDVAKVIPLWGRWEGTFEAETPPAPGTELTVGLTAPSGAQKEVSGFWDGGTTWRVRVMPDEEGQWHYETRATDEHPGLHGRSGQFTSEQIQSDNPFLAHGPVRLSPDRHHLEHADGTAFLYLGDTAWNGPMLAREEDWETFLDDRKAKKYSGIQFVTHAPWVAAFSSRQGELAYTNLEYFPVNPRFFRQIDARIDAINDKGFLALPVLIWAAPFDDAHKWNPGISLPEPQLIKIARYQVARYGAHHVLWILNGDGAYEGQVAEKWKRIGRAVFSGKEHAPVTMHPTGRDWPYETFRDEEWLDVVGYQSGHNASADACQWLHSGPPAREWRRQPTRPVVNLEPCYEGLTAHHSNKLWNARDVRRQCYWSMLNAPPAGLTYGAHGVWCWHEKEQVPLNHDWTGPAKPWHEAKDFEGSTNMQHLVECFSLLRWWQLRPDQDLLKAQPFPKDQTAFVSAARCESGEQAVLYLPTGCKIEIDIDRLRKPVRATWFNPRTGDRSPAAADCPGVYQTPDEQDWVLLTGI